MEYKCQGENIDSQADDDIPEHSGLPSENDIQHTDVQLKTVLGLCQNLGMFGVTDEHEEFSMNDVLPDESFQGDGPLITTYEVVSYQHNAGETSSQTNKTITDLFI